MPRSADYTIQGFLYQFDQTLAELLKASDDATITVEGIVEDIEIESYKGTKAIQCKYHETQTKFALSTLYEPLLQMMRHFKSNPDAEIRYHLFSHFPNQTEIGIAEKEIAAALASKNKGLKGLVAGASGVDVDKFLNVFEFTLTKKHEDLVAENVALLEAVGFAKNEIQAIYYPNAIQLIAELSVKHDVHSRKIKKRDFLAKLRNIRSTAVTQWTLALRTRKTILSARRKQLKATLGTNTRLRHLLIFPTTLENFDDQIVLFIKSLVDKYHFKQAHTQTPLFAVEVDQGRLDDIADRLFGKGVTVNLGRQTNAFVESHFFRDPVVNKDRKEFVLRLICWDRYKQLAIKNKPDDLFVIGDGDGKHECMDLKDVNVEVLAAERFEEVQYILGIADAY